MPANTEKAWQNDDGEQTLYCVCVSQFFYFFYWERFSFSAFLRFMPFHISVFQVSLLKSTVSQLQCSSSLMFLSSGFFILWTSDFPGLFGFRYICYSFLFSRFGPFAKMFSYYRVLIFARGWIVLFWKLEAARSAHLLILFFVVRPFRWSTTTIYFLITINFSVFAFFVTFLCSRVCVIKRSKCLNSSVFHRSVFSLQIFLRVVNATIVTLIPLSFFLWVPRLVDAVDEGFACVRCFCSSFSQIPPWFRLSMLSLKMK